MIAKINTSAFGKNDIRGIYGEDITEDLFYYAAKGYVRFLIEKTNLEPKNIWITVAKDARNHSSSLSKSVIKGIVSSGANVVDIGLVPSPLAYYSEFANFPEEIVGKDKVVGSLTITASHNPSQYNGLKLTYNKRTLTEAEIAEVKNHTLKISREPERSVRYGLTRTYNIINNYIDKMVHQSFSQIGEGVKVVVDSANATAGVVAPKLYRELGCEVVELYSEPDGSFPNHHPNPSEESTLDDIKKKVVEEQADVGIAFDGDSDRIGVIDSKGNKIPGDMLLLLYALEIIKPLTARGEKPAVVAEVKCSQILFDEINANNAKAIMCKTGHGYIKSKMREENAIFGGEMSGHIFFKDRYYGFDDAIYAGCRIIEIISHYKKQNSEFKIEDLVSKYLEMTHSSELRLHCPNELKKSTMEEFNELIKENPMFFGTEIKDIITLDGLRIAFPDGFALIRQSNTEPVFTLRFEALTRESCDKYYDITVSTLEKIINKNK